MFRLSKTEGWILAIFYFLNVFGVVSCIITIIISTGTTIIFKLLGGGIRGVVVEPLPFCECQKVKK